MGELSDFSVKATRQAETFAGSDKALDRPLDRDDGYSLYLFGLPMQAGGDEIIAFHNGYTDELKQKAAFSVALSSQEAPIPGWPAGEWVWRLTGKHVLHPDKFHADQPVLSQISETVGLLENALAGRHDAASFKSRLDRLGLPLEWRNHLANEVYRHADAPLAAAKPPLLSSDPLAALLGQVEWPGETPPASPAAAFIAEVGQGGSGFQLDKAKAKPLLDAFLAFRKHMQAHAEQAGLETLFGWAAGLSALIRTVRGRARQWGWLITPTVAYPKVEEALAGFQGRVEIFAVAGFSSWQELWTSGYQALMDRAGALLIQVPQGRFAEFREAAKATPHAGKIFLMGGEVRCAFGNEGCAAKPAALAYAEACLKSQLPVRQALADPLSLEDQDPCPGRSERHVAVQLLSDTEWMERCRRGENLLNGKLGSAGILFRPLVSAEAAH